MSASQRFPEAPSAWYLVAPSRDVKEGVLLRCGVPGRRAVLTRIGGTPVAFDAACPHVGADLSSGSVSRGKIRCALHAWEFDTSGRCTASPGRPEAGPAPGLVPVPAREAFGGVFLRAGEGPAAFPTFSRLDESRYRFRPGPTVTVRAPWWAVQSNAFDLDHIPIVHARRVEGEPAFGVGPDGAFRLSYRSKPTGRRLSDRVTAFVARGAVEVRTAAFPGSVVVETGSGRNGGALVMGIRPAGEATELTPLFGAPRTGVAPLDALAGRLSAWLFTEFLAPDLPILDGIRFAPRLLPGENPTLAAYLAWAAGLPPVAPGAG